MAFDAKAILTFVFTFRNFNCIQSCNLSKRCTAKRTISNTVIGFRLMLTGRWFGPIRSPVSVINLKAFLTHSVPGDNCIWLLLHAGAPDIIGIWSWSKTRPCLCITWLTFASCDVFNSLGAAVWIIFAFRLLLPWKVMKRATFILVTKLSTALSHEHHCSHYQPVLNYWHSRKLRWLLLGLSLFHNMHRQLSFQ